MPLSDNSKFGVQALTTAVNKIDPGASQIRELGIFEPEYLTTTYADIEFQDGKVHLVASKERGTAGQSVESPKRTVRTVKIPHLPIHDVIRADDVQNLRAFGTTQAATVMDKVNEKLAGGKSDLEYTREHLMLGALQGKILDADGSVILDINTDFKITRKTQDIELSKDTTKVGAVLDKLLSEQRQKFNGAQVRGWVVYCGAEFLSALKEHKSIFEVYKRFDEARAYREGDTLNPSEFVHKGIRFIEYANHFGSAADIGADKAILMPVGRNLYKEYFAPADMNATVNTRALPYYASREKLQHDKGWSLHMQSNPLPIALRPELLATLTMS